MKKALHFGLIFLFVLSLAACSGGKQSAVAESPTSETRFILSSDGVITDSKTGLEWVKGPEYVCQIAGSWVASCKTAGGSWRMPTPQELKTLCQHGVDLRNMEAFQDTAEVWAESGSGFNRTVVDISRCTEREIPKTWELNYRVLGVRSRPK